MTTGEKIRMLRIRNNLSLEEVAHKLDISTQAVHKYETGIVKNIPASRVIAIAKLFHVTPMYLMGWENEPEDKLEISERKKRILELSEISENEKRILELLEGLSDESIAKIIDYAKLLKMAEGENE